MEDINNLTTEQINFALNEGKIKLKSTIAASEFLDKKIFFVMICLVGGIAFLVHTLFANDGRHVMIFFSILFLGFLAAFYKLAKAICTKQFFTLGNHPQKLLDKEYAQYGYKYLVACEALNYDKRIDHNNSINKKKGILVNQALHIIFWSFLGAIFVAISVLIFV
jgi:hypothetical protein